MIGFLQRLRRAAPLPSAPSASPPVDSTLATEADVLACFRLLMGRPPNPEELRGHLAQAGHDLRGVVAGYVNSLEFARRGLLLPPEPDATVADLDGFRIYASAADPSVGRHVLAGVHEPEVQAAFRRVLRPGMGVIDIGANVGFFTMLSASIVGSTGYVLAIEPNPANVRLLEASRRLNGFANVVPAQVAAGQRVGLLVLNSTHSNGTASELGAELGALMQAQTVPCMPVDALVQAGRRIDLIKVDIEGAEHLALQGAEAVLARDRPCIISEFGPSMMLGFGTDGPTYLRWLHARGYTLTVLLPDGGLLDAGQDVAPVMDAYGRCGGDHIDVLAAPL